MEGIKGIFRAVATLTALVFAGIGHASTITLTPDDCDGISDPYRCWTGSVPSEDAAWLAALTGYNAADLSLLYKAEEDTIDKDEDGIFPIEEEGTFADNYTTTFSNEQSDPQDALIEWTGGAYIDCTDGCLLVANDGNQDPNTYVFELFADDWDGMMDIFLDGFWPGRGAISHVSIWGGDRRKVPEPASLALLGLGLVGLGLMRRRRTT